MEQITSIRTKSKLWEKILIRLKRTSKSSKTWLQSWKRMKSNVQSVCLVQRARFGVVWNVITWSVMNAESESLLVQLAGFDSDLSLREEIGGLKNWLELKVKRLISLMRKTNLKHQVHYFKFQGTKCAFNLKLSVIKCLPAKYFIV